MNLVNTKVVANFFILHVLKFNVIRLDGLGAIDVRVLLLGFTYVLNRSN
jgi:hypothetical protein